MKTKKNESNKHNIDDKFSLFTSDDKRDLRLTYPNPQFMVNFIKNAMLEDCKDVFLSFSLLFTEKRSCKRENVEARYNIFAKLVKKKDLSLIHERGRSQIGGRFSFSGNTSSPKKSLSNKTFSYHRFVSGFKRISERWSKYTLDELLSLCVMIDINQYGLDLCSSY